VALLKKPVLRRPKPLLGKRRIRDSALDRPRLLIRMKWHKMCVPHNKMLFPNFLLCKIARMRKKKKQSPDVNPKKSKITNLIGSNLSWICPKSSGT
jgi:hypothetical protein